jgi:WD40 repeat protein
MHPSGNRFAFGRADGSVHVWDYKERREIRQWSAHAQAVSALAVCPLTTQLATASVGGEVKLWDSDAGRLMRSLPTELEEIHSLAWSRDSRYLAASGKRGVGVWDLETDQPIRLLREHLRSASAVAFGTGVLALSGPDNDVEIRTIPDGELRQTLRGHTGIVTALHFSPDGSQLFSGGQDAAVRVWDVARGVQLRVFPQVENRFGAPSALAVDPQMRFLIGDSPGHGPMIWDLQRGLAVGQVYSGGLAQFVPDGSAVLFGRSGGGVTICTREEIEQSLKAAQGSDAGSATSGLVRIDVDATLVPGGHSSPVWGVAASPDGRWVATASHEQTVNLWDASTMKLVRTLQGHSSLVWCVAFSPDSKYLASGSGEVLVWDVATGKIVHRLEGHKDLVISVAFHPTQPWLASSSQDRTLRLWRLSADPQSLELHRFESYSHSVAFSPDGKTLAAGVHDHHVALWRLTQWPTGPKEPDRLLSGRKGAVWSVGFSSDGGYLASGSEQGVITLWDGHTFERAVTLRGGAAQVRTVAFSRDNQLLLGASYQGPTIVWDLKGLRKTLGEMKLDW